MQNSNEPVQQTDKNKGDQSAVEQQQKEQTGKNPSPENMSGAQNAQQGTQQNAQQSTQQKDPADQQVTGQKQHVTNNDGAPVNASDARQGKGAMSGQDQKTMRSGDMSDQDQANKDMGQDKDRQNDQSSSDQSQGNKGGMGSEQGQGKNQGR